MARHPEITQKNKVTILLRYLKKKVNDEVDFLHVDKDENLLQIDSMILARMVKHSQIFKKVGLEYPYDTSKNKLRMNFVFCMQINI